MWYNVHMFVVEITEVLQRRVEIDSDNAADALHIAKSMYRSGEIVLDSSDHVETSFGVCQ